MVYICQTMIKSKAVSNVGKLLLGRIRIIGAIIPQNTNRRQIVTVMQCCHFHDSCFLDTVCNSSNNNNTVCGMCVF